MCGISPLLNTYRYPHNGKTISTHRLIHSKA
nr:MAG TPA: hypothetical protein [Caudoviricetes sp.]